jgi:hypothetical protein
MPRIALWFLMEPLKAVLIHLVVPGAGVLFYLSIVRKMLDQRIKDPPVLSLFVIFATWGSLLILILTRFFWLWSGMATLGLAYLVILAPIVMGIITVRIYLDRELSRFHKGGFCCQRLLCSRNCLRHCGEQPMEFSL